MKTLIMPVVLAGLAGMLGACSPKQAEEPAAPAAAEESAPAGGMQEWGEATTTVVDMELATPPGEQSAPPVPPTWDPGSMQSTEASPAPQMWGADGSKKGDTPSPEVPVLQGPDDLFRSQSPTGQPPVPVLNSPADLMQGQTNPVPVLQSPEDLMESGQ
jgi:hypothetical protein